MAVFWGRCRSCSSTNATSTAPTTPTRCFTPGADSISASPIARRKDYNNSNPNSGAGWAAGRFFVGSDLWGSQTNTYIADDTTIDMGVRPTYVYQNVGEQLLWEGQSPVGGGTFLAATANALTLKGLPSGVGMGYYAIIVSGDGVGEDDPITSYNASTGLITLAQPWTVTPDASSVIGIGEIFTNIVVYDNTLQGKGVTQTASTGVQFWGGVSIASSIPTRSATSTAESPIPRSPAAAMSFRSTST